MQSFTSRSNVIEGHGVCPRHSLKKPMEVILATNQQFGLNLCVPCLSKLSGDLSASGGSRYRGPVKFRRTYFTGVAPEDGTGVSSVFSHSTFDVGRSMFDVHLFALCVPCLSKLSGDLSASGGSRTAVPRLPR